MEKKFRNTKQKELILDCLKRNRERHITADNIVDFLKRENATVGKATVYRFLSYLENQGLVKKYALPENQSACYQYVDDGSGCGEHYHLVCDSCGQVTHFESPLLQNAIKDTCTRNSFSVDERKTVFHGVCADCKDCDNGKDGDVL